jgi:hypothetical protein
MSQIPLRHAMMNAVARVEEAQAEFYKARNNLDAAKEQVVQEVISAGWSECLSVNMGRVRNRLRHG